MKNVNWPLLLALTLPTIGSTTGAQSIYTPYGFSGFAGSAGGWGDVDGVGTAARFKNPSDVKLDRAGNLYVADGDNQTIRKITLVGGSWVVTTLAGSPRANGTVDATNSAARFNNPTGLAVDGAGNVYVADQADNTIRKVTPAGVVTTVAGTALSSGNKDGTNSVARFNLPAGLAVDGETNIYVADSGNLTIRKITPVGTNWVVTTIAGSPGISGSSDGTNNSATFGRFINGPPSIAVDHAGNLYVADIGNSTIRKITPIGTNWVVSTLAGSAGQIGFSNGTNSAARFYNPYGVAVDNVGNLYVGDGNLVRKITPLGTNWVVTTLAGDTAFGSVDGVGSAAEFNSPKGLDVDSAGNLYVVDGYNSTIRFITPANVVTTLAGMPYHYGTADGVANAARFNLPFGVAVDSQSNIYVGDQGNHTIRKVTPGGVVSTLAGNAGNIGSPDGTNTAAYFNQPSGLAIDGAGNIYVADAGNYKIRRVSPVGTNWVVTTLAGGGGIGSGSADGTNKTAQFRNCYGLAVDAATNIYVADTYNHTIRRVSPVGTNWVVKTLAGTAFQSGSADGTNKSAQFYYPYGVAVDTASNVYVADYYNMAIRKVTPIGTNWVVTTIAGSLGFFGSADGTNSAARFLYPQGITIDPAGNLFVSDGGNDTIRRLVHSGTNWVVTTLGGAPRADGVGQAGIVNGVGSAARLNNPYGLALDPAGDLFIASAGENLIVRASPLLLFDSTTTGFTPSSKLFHFRLTGLPGSNTVVDVSTDLQNWTPVQTNTMSPIGISISLPATNLSSSFRARLIP